MTGLFLLKMQILIKCDQEDGTKDWTIIEMQVLSQSIKSVLFSSTVFKHGKQYIVIAISDRAIWNLELEILNSRQNLSVIFITPELECQFL